MKTTNFYTDIKTAIYANGVMINGEVIYTKMKKVGFDVTRIYFDTPAKDCVINETRIKRVINP